MQTSYNKLAARLSAPPAKAHFIGIGGIGMAGVAYLLRKLGWEVTGCDAADNPLLEWLNANGITTYTEHSPAHLIHLDPEKDIVVRTPAVPMSSPELLEALENSLPVYDRGILLAVLSGLHDTIAVCGTHGKTTTTSFIAGILKSVMPEKTAWCIGGMSPYLGAVAGGACLDSPSRRGFLVAEADESDATLAIYTPAITVLTNLDPDHMEHFRGIQELENTFRSVLSRTAQTIVYCADHPRAAAIAKENYPAPAVSFGFSPKADYRISDAQCGELKSTFKLAVRQGPSAVISIGMPGVHNVMNAAAAVAAACAAGVEFKDAYDAIEKTAVLPARRFERIGKPEGFTVISDYSHHPVEIAALVETALTLPHKRILAVFQPHRYSRTRTLLRTFPKSFSGLDELVLCPVYCASEDPICGGAASDLYAAFRTEAATKISIPIPVLARSLDGASSYVRAILQPGDVVLVIGAGDVNTIAPEIAASRPVAKLPEVVRIGAFGTAAIAPGFVAVRSLETLCELVAKGPFSLIGGGTNSFIIPTGCHQTLIHLTGTGFSEKKVLSETADSLVLEVGAAVQGPSLMRFCAEHGYSGLEFMTGIPGCCGGWLAMNAGTRLGAFCDAVLDVDVVAPDGTLNALPAADLGATYRSCPGLRGRVAVRMRIQLRKASPQAVRKAMDEAMTQRMDFSGIRTAGSVFKNPGEPLPPAGLLLEKAGCKGMRIGGAYVTTRHANVIAADQDVTASDIYALMHMMREKALESSGVRLEPEVRILN